MAIHIRNLRTPTLATSSSFYRWALWLIREAAVEVGGWSEDFKTTDSAWASASNLLLTVSDAAVTAANPKKITSTTGGFTGHDDDVVTLKATNDQNKGIFAIEYVEDDNTLYIKDACKPANGWTDESGITARIHNCGQGALLATSAVELVLGPPTGNNQAYFQKTTTSYNLNIKSYPKGDYAGAATATVTRTANAYSDFYYGIFNIYMDGPNLFISMGEGVYFWLAAFGELTSVSASDLYPGFCSGAGYGTSQLVYSPGYYHSTAGLSTLSMIGHSDGQVTGYTMILKDGVDASTDYDFWDGYQEHIFRPNRLKMQGGKTKVMDLWVCMDDVPEGGYVRGKHPYFRQCNNNAPKLSGVGANFYHMMLGGTIPRNGLNDDRVINTGV